MVAISPVRLRATQRQGLFNADYPVPDVGQPERLFTVGEEMVIHHVVDGIGGLHPTSGNHAVLSGWVLTAR